MCENGPRGKIYKIYRREGAYILYIIQEGAGGEKRLNEEELGVSGKWNGKGK